MTTSTDFESQQRLRELLTVMWLDGHIELTDGPDDIDDVVTVGESSINAALDDNPADWTLRSIYADWLEEQGNPRAESMRWMVEHRQCPVHTYAIENHGHCWMWWTDSQWPCRGTVSVANGLLNGIESLPNRFEYPNRLAAEIDLHDALVKAGEITCALIDDKATHA